ncbi:uroporphyrinogen-III synthase [Carbonactinospora thermoautotrophica]|uniref:uroporphyrinogen-III synthase n=1 Tax=Carbonactinospora thermoautotrophica TaxID=1469144 RepID=UPI00226DD2B3|nr:uroporphyrinogen-III synthase [Carbonactinospora thermoautotrophica]MCX9191606.1 uroporphyrinogen-III synthase [Carbonactinospora thermoautotrophica]
MSGALAYSLPALHAGPLDAGPGPLAGFTIGVTADQRRAELAALLERRGARVIQAPALRIVPLPDDRELLAATRRCLATPPDFVIATTGVGFRGWLEAVEGWGLREALVDRLAAATLVARGRKTCGAVRAAGLVETWAPPAESLAEILAYLLAEGVAGKRVAVQLQGEPQPGFAATLREAGAEVVEIPVYRWQPPADTAPLRRLIEQIVTGQVDALTFTSAPAASGLLRTAREDGLEEALLAALRSQVLAFCVGPIAASPLTARGVPTRQPGRRRLGSLVHELVTRLPAERGRVFRAAGHVLEIRGHAVLVDGELRVLPPAPMAVLRALARRPGRVLSRAELLRALPRGEDEHAVEMAVARLRHALGRARCVQTVVKRGYRLAVDPEACR